MTTYMKNKPIAINETIIIHQRSQYTEYFRRFYGDKIQPLTKTKLNSLSFLSNTLSKLTQESMMRNYSAKSNELKTIKEFTIV